MPKHQWPVDYAAVSEALLTFDPSGTLTKEPSALAFWAMQAVDALHYLRDLDQEDERARWVGVGHDSDTIDLAHARWATATAMTALDLCAAAAGARHAIPIVPPRVHDLGTLERRRADLCQGCSDWLTTVLDDPDYKTLRDFRKPLTHRRLARHIYMSAGAAPPPPRLGLYASTSSDNVSTEALINLGLDVATTHVTKFLEAAIAGDV